MYEKQGKLKPRPKAIAAVIFDYVAALGIGLLVAAIVWLIIEFTA